MHWKAWVRSVTSRMSSPFLLFHLKHSSLLPVPPIPVILGGGWGAPVPVMIMHLPGWLLVWGWASDSSCQIRVFLRAFAGKTILF